ncbi:MAG TPA: helical backbone metal receptor [Polyangiaceae bacterium]|jgi:ABC-type Fe3+-hydroxamate transport system substrate-binding protein
MMLKLFDDRNRELLFARPPRRVVSLVPSDTFSVAALGCFSALVGRTDFCELPPEVSSVPSVGGTKNPRVDDIAALEPDLILANQEENTKSDLEALAQRGFRVYVAFPKRVADGIAHLAKLARIFDVQRDGAARGLLKQAYDAHRRAEAERASAVPVRTFCPIWMEPLMTIHGATFISDMLDLVGAQNVFADRERRYPLAADLGRAKPLPPEKVGDRDVRYPRVTMEEVNARAPELVLLPDEPHPFSDADAEVFRAQPTPAAARGAVLKISGKDLCWYGAQSAEGIDRLKAVIAAAPRAPLS